MQDPRKCFTKTADFKNIIQVDNSNISFFKKYRLKIDAFPFFY